MSIYLNKDSKVIVQGITGGEGTKHTALMLKAGTQVVGGVNARKAGTTVSHVDKDGSPIELPVFGTVAEAIAATGADVCRPGPRTQVSLEPPPWLELTTSEPRRSATRVSPPGTMVTSCPHRM